MDDTLTFELPFVKDLPKREKTKLQKVWDAFAELRRVTAEKGALVPAPFAGRVLGVSPQRIHELILDGRLERVEVHGHNYLTEKSVIEFAKAERKAGRPVKAPQGNLEVLKVARLAAADLMRKNS